jgi:OmpA family
MKTADAPELVEPRSVPSEAYIRRLAWSLYNFEVGDATLKPGHKDWIDKNLIPLLSIFGAQVRLRGTASSTGSAGVNQKLSEKRVAAVRDYLVKRGASPTQFASVTATGETDALSAGPNDTEDARYRAVVIEISFPMPTAPARFDRRNWADRNDGFDDSSEPLRPPWVLVRLEQGSRVVRLENGIGLKLVSTNPDVVQVEHTRTVGQPLIQATQSPQFMRLRCGRVDDAEVHAVDGSGRAVARLRVAVRQRFTVRVTFLYVKNRFRRYSTHRVPGGEEQFLTKLNQIYEPQTNIRFALLPGGARLLSLSDRLGREINVFEGHDEEWDAIVKHRFPDARINFFMVREVEHELERGRNPRTGRRRRESDTVGGSATVGGTDSLIEDDLVSDVGNVLAHEAGHCLSVRHNDPIVSTSEMLMYETAEGAFIPRVHALRMRTSV